MAGAGVLFAPQLDTRRQLSSLALGAAFVSLASRLAPVIEWYRGASGALHALFFAGASAAAGASLARGRRGRRWPVGAVAAG